MRAASELSTRCAHRTQLHIAIKRGALTSGSGGGEGGRGGEVEEEELHGGGRRFDFRSRRCWIYESEETCFAVLCCSGARQETGEARDNETCEQIPLGSQGSQLTCFPATATTRCCNCTALYYSKVHWAAFFSNLEACPFCRKYLRKYPHIPEFPLGNSQIN